METTWKALGRKSVLARLGLAMGLIVGLAMLSIFLSTILNELSTGKAQAINNAGSLRMLSYRAAALAGDDSAVPEQRLRSVEAALADFEQRLQTESLIAAQGQQGSSPLFEEYRQIGERWRQAIRPAILAMAERGHARREFQGLVDDFVWQIDRYVLLLERDMEERVQLQRMIQSSSMVIIMLIVIVVMVMMQLQVVLPLNDLLRCSKAISAGDFSARAAVHEQDELGQLASAFNLMVEDLSGMYARLEQQVAEKTRDLEESKRSLELLYRTVRTLTEQPLSRETLLDVLHDIERTFSVGSGAICVTEPGIDRALALVTDLPLVDGAYELCERTHCVECLERKNNPNRNGLVSMPELQVVSVPLNDGSRDLGLMPLTMHPGRQLSAAEEQLLTTVGRHIGSALATVRRNDELRRLALLEERSAIARELHDSLAQALSYLKIQVTRLEALLGRQAPAEQTQAVVDELRDGLSAAYRQLRELLTTFRLRIEGTSLLAAFEAVIADFEKRSGLTVVYANHLRGFELDANAGIHLLQVVREALANVERHARAQHVWLDIRRDEGGRISVRIDDDGIGIPDGPPPTHHYGLIIMQDRAASLGGSLAISRRPEGGTRVELVFAAGNPYDAVHEQAPAGA
jgi:two-component system, NarL family, nitrate/nitrite sensor histidine kinase NarX